MRGAGVRRVTPMEGGRLNTRRWLGTQVGVTVELCAVWEIVGGCPGLRCDGDVALLLRQRWDRLCHDIAQWFVEMPVCSADGLVPPGTARYSYRRSKVCAAHGSAWGRSATRSSWTMERDPYSR